VARLWRAAVALQGLTSAVVLSAKRYVCLAAYLVVIRSVLPLRFGVEASFDTSLRRCTDTTTPHRKCARPGIEE